MTTPYNNLSDSIQIAAATGNNERLLDLEGDLLSAYFENELTDLEFSELMGDIAGGLQ